MKEFQASIVINSDGNEISAKEITMKHFRILYGEARV